MSPNPFSLYTEKIMREIEDVEGVKIKGINVNNIRFVDGTALVADSEDKLQKLLDVVVEHSDRMGLYMNKNKSFCLVASKRALPPRCQIKVHEETLGQVGSFCDLGIRVTSDARCDADTKARIGQAKAAFEKMKSVLTKRRVKISTRLRLLKCYVWSVLLYGSETWTISATMRKRLEAMEMWCYPRMLKLSWTKKVTNVEVFIMSVFLLLMTKNTHRCSMALGRWHKAS